LGTYAFDKDRAISLLQLLSQDDDESVSAKAIEALNRLQGTNLIRAEEPPKEGNVIKVISEFFEYVEKWLKIIEFLIDKATEKKAANSVRR